MHRIMNKFWLIAAGMFLAIFMSANGLAQAPSQTGIRILGISVQGNQTANSEQIRVSSGLQVDQSVTMEDIQRAQKRLWELGLFKDIKIFAEEDAANNGVFLIIQVQENPRLGSIEYRGNKKIKASKFREELDLLAGQVLSGNDMFQAAKTIEGLYEEKNFLLADVDTLTRPVEDREGYVDLIFDIDEGGKVKVREITFHGNAAFPDGKLQRQMDKVKEQRWWKFFQSVEYTKENLLEDEALISNFYKSNGYRDIEVVKDSIYYSDDRTKMFIDIWLDEGRIYDYGNFTWEGNTLYDAEELEQALGIDNGEQYNYEKFQMGLENIRSLYMDRGYLYFQVIPREVPAGEDVVDITFQVQENHLVTVRNIDITGNTKTKEDVIRRELVIFPGDRFSRDKLIRSQREIFILNYFGNVVPDVVPVNDEQVDLEIEVEEKQTDRANASVGYSERDKFIGSVGVEFNNFMGNGQQIGLSYQRGRFYQAFNFSFNEPWPFNRPNPVGFRLFYSERGQGSGSSFFGPTTSYYYPFDIVQRGGSVSIGHRFRWPDTFFRGNWTFYADSKHYSAIQDSSTYEYVNRTGVNPTYGVRLTQTVRRDSRDRPEFPTRGSRMNWQATLSGGPLGGNEEYHKHELQFEWWTPLLRDLFVLYTDVEVGVMKQLYQDAVIPWEEQFFMGGSGMIWGTALRGYEDRSVGPISSNGYPLGGRALLKYSMEFRVKVSDNPTIYGLTFAEAGNTYLDALSINPYDLKRSAGIGARVFMPMLGMLGFDLGYGFDPQFPGGDDSGWNTHFIFGQQF